ncbi:MAG TPA: HAD-IIB family hydrolase [Candidatus Paceibacterota bacterium]|nr:HAD-IIB family hydrolase [Candidatus Paceibacterota bacterium]
MIMDKQLFIFDIDNTLTESRTPMDAEMADLICTLLKEKRVALISGGTLDQFQKQCLTSLSCVPCFKNLILLPTTGALLYTWNGTSWVKRYEYSLSRQDRESVYEGLSRVLGMSPEELASFIDDRGTQITYSGLGKNASPEEKKQWDPHQEKRRSIVEKLKHSIKKLHMALGGTTSIDFTGYGIDKAFGVSKVLEYLSLDPHETLFVGDALYKGGNDEPVKRLAVETRITGGPEETKQIIRSFLS